MGNAAAQARGNRVGDVNAMPAWAQFLSALIGAGAIGSWATLLRVGRQNRKDDAETEKVRVATAKDVFDELEKIRVDCLKLQDENADCRRENVTLKRQNAEMLGRIAALERHAVAQRFDVFDPSICAIMDRSNNDGWVFSQVVDGEPFLIYVNRYFAKRLGRTQDEIVKAGWRVLVHPEDEHDTQEAFRSAMHGNLIDFPIRFLHADGSWIPLLWTAAKVDPTGRGTFALAQFSERRVES